MELCGSGLLPLVKAYPTALNCFSENCKSLITRMSDRFGGSLASPWIMRAARLRYAREESDFQIIETQAVEAKIKLVLRQTRDTTLPGLQKLSLSALCVILELGEDANRIIHTYSQQALAEMARKPGAEFDIARQATDAQQSTEVTQDEQKRFMTAAFIFESYCLTFFRGQQFLYEGNDLYRWQFLNGPIVSNMNTSAVGRFYCIMYHIMQEHQDLLLSVIVRLESIHGKTSPSMTVDHPKSMERIFLKSVQHDHVPKALDYLYYLASHGLKMLTSLQEMSIVALTEFTVTTFLEINRSYYPAVSRTIEPRHFLQEPSRVNWSPWICLADLLDPWNAWDVFGVWQDTWRRAVPFWDPSEDKVPYGVLRAQYNPFWFLYRSY